MSYRVISLHWTVWRFDDIQPNTSRLTSFGGVGRVAYRLFNIFYEFCFQQQQQQQLAERYTFWSTVWWWPLLGEQILWDGTAAERGRRRCWQMFIPNRFDMDCCLLELLDARWYLVTFDDFSLPRGVNIWDDEMWGVFSYW